MTDDDATRLMPRPVQPESGEGSALPPGTILLHTYRIESLIARGGMGEIYRAEHIDQKTKHAIKIILPELSQQQRIVDMFLREAEALRKIRVDAIVAYDGLFRDERGRLYLVMEFVDGPSLGELMKRGPLMPEEVRSLTRRLAEGLGYAHDKGIYHRDLSPDNIILPAGRLDDAKIIDFGIAKVDDPAHKTIVGTDFAGKLSWASPEQLGLYGGKVDARSDIYSLGLVLAAAAIGKPIDMGRSMTQVLEARRKVPDLSRIPAEIEVVLAKMLEPDPADRPQSLSTVAALLADSGKTRKDRDRDDDRPSDKRRSVVDDADNSPGRSKLLVIAAVLGVVVLAAAGGGAYYIIGGNDSGGGGGTATTDPSTTSGGTSGQVASSGGATTDPATTSGAGATDSSGGTQVVSARSPGDLANYGQGANLAEFSPDTRTWGPGDLRTISTLSGPEIFWAARQFLDRGDLDTALVLLEFASEKGSGAAALALGQMYDPQLWSKVPTPFSQPNAEKAGEYYARAVELGEPGADQRLTALRGG